MLKSALAVVVGLVLGGVVIMLVQQLGMLLMPLPDSVDPMRPEPGDLHAGNFLAVLVAWGVGSFVGGGLAARLAPDRASAHAFFVGFVFLAAGIYNMTVIPSPIWFVVIGVLLFIPCALIGAAVLRRSS